MKEVVNAVLSEIDQAVNEARRKTRAESLIARMVGLLQELAQMPEDDIQHMSDEVDTQFHHKVADLAMFDPMGDATGEENTRKIMRAARKLYGNDYVVRAGLKRGEDTSGWYEMYGFRVSQLFTRCALAKHQTPIQAATFAVLMAVATAAQKAIDAEAEQKGGTE